MSIITAEEIPESGGGKNALLTFFGYARRHKFLTDDFKGKRTISIFVLDKDLDDVRRNQKRSAHVIYTPTYELENLLFLHGDLVAATAAAGCLAPLVVQARLGDANQWCAAAAACWKQWAKLCAFSVLKAETPRGFYGRSHSEINETPYAPTNHARFRNIIMSFENEWLDANVSFDAAFGGVERLVQRAYDGGRADKFFKGKWYGHFVESDVERLMGSRKWHRSGFQQRLLACLNMTFDTQAPWAVELRSAAENLLRAGGIKAN